MEKNVKASCSLWFNRETLKETEEEAKQSAIEELGSEDGKNELRYPDVILDIDEMYLEEGGLIITGNFVVGKKHLGDLHVTIPLGIETNFEITRNLLEKMEKVKAVMEATK